MSRTGKLEAARALAEEVRQSALAEGDAWNLALANEHLAFFCLLLSRLEEGMRYSQLSVALWSDLHDLAHEATARATLGSLKCEAGDEDAINEVQRAVVTAERSGDNMARSFAANARCVVLWMLRQHDLADQAGGEAVAFARLAGDPVTVGRWLSNAALPVESLANAATRSGDHAMAGVHWQRALVMTREGAMTCLSAGDSWGAFLAFCNLADYQIATGALADAETSLQQARLLAEVAGVEQHVVVRHMTGLLLAATGQSDAAVTVLQEALKLALDQELLCISVQIARQASDTLAKCGRYKEALTLYRDFFDLHERRSSDQIRMRARMLAHESQLEQLRRQSAHFERLSTEDPVTGLSNRRQLDLQLATLRPHASRFSVALIDIDHFKRVNDMFSHFTGDQVLRQVGAILSAQVRAGDVVGRFGGEEFLLILPDASPMDGLMLCERVRRAIARNDWQGVDARLAVTVSIGLAGSHEAADVTALLALADSRLYAAKRAGRDRVNSHASPAAAPAMMLTA